jgi:hypothetical protein
MSLDVLKELTCLEAPPPVKRSMGATFGFHHMQARMLAEGKRPGEVAAALGTSTARLHTLLDDPAFQELVSYYQEQEKVVYLENREKAALLGRLAMDLIQERLEVNGEGVPLSELRQLATEFGDRSDFAKVQAQGGATAVPVITFNFGQLPGRAEADGFADGFAEGFAKGPQLEGVAE